MQPYCLRTRATLWWKSNGEILRFVFKYYRIICYYSWSNNNIIIIMWPARRRSTDERIMRITFGSSAVLRAFDWRGRYASLAQWSGGVVGPRKKKVIPRYYRIERRLYVYLLPRSCYVTLRPRAFFHRGGRSSSPSQRTVTEEGPTQPTRICLCNNNNSAKTRKRKI